MIVLLKAARFVCLVVSCLAVAIGIMGLFQGGEAAVTGLMFLWAAVLLGLLYPIRQKLRALTLAHLEESEGPTC